MATAAAKTSEEVAELADAEANGAAKKKLPLKLIIIAAVALLALGGGGYVMLHHKGEKVAEEAPKPKPAVFVDLPDVLVNLSTGANERTQYLKVKVVLEVADQKVIEQIQPIMPRVMDAFQTYLRELRPTDLDGSAGLYRLKEELTRRVNVAIAPNHVNAVLFKEIVLQ